MIAYLKQNWFFNTKADILAGATSTLALIPDALAFSFIAGVNPMIGVYSTISILIVISFFGGRPAMLSSSAGSMSVLMSALVAHYGLQYLFATTILTGIIQFLMGRLKLGQWMSYVPHAVVTGFVNALAILVFLAQLKNFRGESWPMYVVVAGTLLIIYLLPKFTKVIPAPLVAVVVMTIVTVTLGLHTRTVGDIATITRALPTLRIPDVPFTLHTLLIVLPTALSLAVVGYSETLLTQVMIDEITETKTDKNREMTGQGIANVVSGLFGGMAGCALVAESVMNTKLLGGRGRLSTLTAGIVLFLLVQVFGGVVSSIPMAALVGVMFMICSQIFDWGYLRNIHRIPKSEAFVMIVTVAVVVPTQNLAIGVITGVALSAIVFVYKISKVQVRPRFDGDEQVYFIRGQLFFGSTTHFENAINFNESVQNICLDLTGAHVWDHAAQVALNRVTTRLRNQGKNVRVKYGTHSLRDLSW
ncbi:SulP family inorganic anion transporter [Alicyclobacillus fodiniaquatilis]|uniref:SulP family inorganic anion transporter n=1 Tax=Alicyclobacillus fodiniaquatilis TaxID=1661150 RepID=A0ABW4JMP0_9BACL